MRTHGAFHYSIDVLDAAAKECVFWNRERGCILIVAQHLSARAKSEPKWVPDNAERWCCGKHASVCCHGGAFDADRDFTANSYLQQPLGFHVSDPVATKQQLQRLGLIPEDGAEAPTANCPCVSDNPSPPGHYAPRRDREAQLWFGSEMEEWYSKPQHAHLRFDEFNIIRHAYQAAADANLEELRDVQIHLNPCEEEDEADSAEVTFLYTGFSLSVRLFLVGTHTGDLAP